MWYFIPVVLIAGYFVVRRVAHHKQRARLVQTPMTDHDWALALETVPLAANMPAQLQRQLQGKVNLFLDQVDIYGQGGLEIDRRMEVSVATQACLLVVNTDAWYDTLRTILLYPGAFRSRQTTHDGYLVTEQDRVALGESWHRGPVVLSWPHAEQGGLNEEDGHNVVLHEFAHQLDALSGDTNAVPILAAGQDFKTWEAAIMDGFDRHLDNVERGRKTVLDAYGATNYVEFLAVSIEVFFEKPAKYQAEYPDVYRQISILLNLDPLDWG